MVQGLVHLIFLIWVQLLLASAASAIPQLRIKAEIAFDSDENIEISGTMKVLNWHGSGPHCLYLPYSDPEFNRDPLRDDELIPKKVADVKPVAGFMEVTGVNSKSHGHIFEVSAAESEFRFRSSPPRWSDSPKDEWVLSDFYPQLLTHCPNDQAPSILPLTEIELDLRIPPRWQILTPATSRESEQQALDNHYMMRARKLPVALVRGWNIKHDWISGIEIEWADRADEISIRKDVVTHSINLATENLGKLPFNKLVIMTTSDLQKSASPGLITLNRSKAANFNHLQSDASYWVDWQLAVATSEQWLGGFYNVETLDDIWLLRGFNEFHVEMILRSLGRKYNLLKYPKGLSEDEFDRKINVNYRQTQDLAAGYLTLMQPEHTLTNEQFVTKASFKDQFGLGFIRATLSLRQLRAQMGEESFRRILIGYLSRTSNGVISPQGFARFLMDEAASSLNETERFATKQALKVWWTQSQWPDFRLGRIDETKVNESSWTVSVEV